MHEELLAEFPDVSYETWRAQVEKDLKGADFEKRLTTRTLEGIVVRPLYTARDVASEPDAGGFAGLPPYRRGGSLLGHHGVDWDVRAEERASDAATAQRDIADDLAGGARSLWLRFDAAARSGDAKSADGLACADLTALDALLQGVDLAKVAVALDAGGNLALPATFLALASRRGVDLKTLRGELGCDPLAALARDGSLPCELERAAASLGELMLFCARSAPQLKAAAVSSEPYHSAGAHCGQELAYALATGLSYLRWGLAAGASVDEAGAAISFSMAVASDMFLELAKLRALRLCWAKVVAAHGGSARAQNTHVHAFTSPRTKTVRDPWVNMLRSTTEAFAAMVGGADAVTTRGFDEAIGVSDGFARRIGRNVQIILNEEANVTHVADAAGGSYYVETLTDELARSAWTRFQDVERRGGMAELLTSGALAHELAVTAAARAQAVAKRQQPLTGISEFANVTEEPVVRPAPPARKASAIAKPADAAQAALAQLKAAKDPQRIAAAIAAATAGAPLAELTRALAGDAAKPARCEALPVRRQAEAFEALRTRADRQQQSSGARPSAFLCNLGPIPKHKTRASFAASFLQAGGIVPLDNDGFADVDAAVEAFAKSGAGAAVICGSDEQ
jgi:methylmalonyl-CoA mutase